ncbi:MAG: metallophosphoesterase [Verrucomicrobiota bacterium]|nr:metallophosphoesterase [Verrucomicrobiota bacterium]
MSRISRRKFLQLGGLALPAIAGIEPERLRETNLQLNRDGNCRFVHFSDLHYQGDENLASETVRAINQLGPDFVCFTGDLVEDRSYLPEALRFIREIRAPVYGIPGNHDYWSRAPFSEYERAFAATGGAWQPNRSVVLAQHDLELVGMGIGGMPAIPAAEVTRHLLLIHYPVMADRLGRRCFDLILAGHSHGGQVRIPFVGPLVVPPGVGGYDYGRYETPGGPLYVNAGIGTLSSFPVRWNCPPEITVVTI